MERNAIVIKKSMGRTWAGTMPVMATNAPMAHASMASQRMLINHFALAAISWFLMSGMMVVTEPQL